MVCTINNISGQFNLEWKFSTCSRFTSRPLGRFTSRLSPILVPTNRYEREKKKERKKEQKDDQILEQNNLI